MPIVLYLGKDIKEYRSEREEIIKRKMIEGEILCEYCTKSMSKHSNYDREIKESGEKIAITVVWCKPCRNWHALLPDFLLFRKHYSGNEVEAVIIDSATEPVSHIDTKASESTVRRWIVQIGEKIKQATGKLKYHFMRLGRTVSEIEIDPGPAYSELEQVLEKAPSLVKSSGNKLGLANIWLMSTDMPSPI